MKNFMIKHFLILIMLMFTAMEAEAQTTAFNFQGRLNDGGAAANANYDFQFKLFDALAGGNQVASTVTRANLQVINGVFSTTLDFGAIFDAGNRFLEISVRPAGSPNAHVVLGARQQILAVPFAVQATNSTNSTNATNAQTAVNATTSNNALALGGTAASEFARLNSVNTGSLEITGDLKVGGNMRQSNTSYGGVKAMLHAKPNPSGANPTVVKCYNAITNSSVPPCGFSVIRAPASFGVYKIDFGFAVTDRIVSVTAEYASGCEVIGNICGGIGHNFGANFVKFNTTTIDVFTFAAGNSDDTADAAFTIVLY